MIRKRVRRPLAALLLAGVALASGSGRPLLAAGGPVPLLGQDPERYGGAPAAACRATSQDSAPAVRRSADSAGAAGAGIAAPAGSTAAPGIVTAPMQGHGGSDADVAGQSPAAAPAVPGAAEAAGLLELALFACANDDRTAHGLAPLALDGELVPIARARAAAQVPLPRLSHFDAAGAPALGRLFAAGGVTYRLAGENLVRLAEPESDPAAYAEAALMRSPAHRALILKPDYQLLAVGVAADERGRLVFAQLFRALW